ncbi:MAG: hypothetical protein LWW86_12035 [Micrococcales bacterium]|nr:hypothetical protein [Micrococcales bacterium]
MDGFLDSAWPYFIALAPSVGVLFLFYLVIKNMIEGDRRERIAHAQWEAEHEKDTAAPRADQSPTE